MVLIGHMTFRESEPAEGLLERTEARFGEMMLDIRDILKQKGLKPNGNFIIEGPETKDGFQFYFLKIAVRGGRG